MIRLGEKQDLTVVKLVDFGVYLASEEDKEDKVLLPCKQVPEGTKEGDVLCVFVYRDSKDRLIATTHEVRLTRGEVGLLEVSQVGIGEGPVPSVPGTDKTRTGRGRLPCGTLY